MIYLKYKDKNSQNKTSILPDNSDEDIIGHNIKIILDSGIKEINIIIE